VRAFLTIDGSKVTGGQRARRLMILSTTSTAMARMQEMRSQKGQRWRDESLRGRDLMQVVLVLDTEELNSGQSRETAKEGNVRALG
jgi:hypothetical protein